MTVDIPGVEALKAQAARLRKAMAEQGHDMSHSQSLEALAKQYGLRDWNTLSAKAARPNLPVWKIGQRVSGRYLGHAFQGTLKGASEITTGVWKMEIVFDEPVDVVASPHFSNFRRQIRATVTSDGSTRDKTSDGQAHLVLDMG